MVFFGLILRRNANILIFTMVLAQSEQRVLWLLVQMWESIYSIQEILIESNAFCADQVLENELAENLYKKVFRKFVKGTNFGVACGIKATVQELIIKCSHVLFVTACILMTGRVVLKQRPAYSDFRGDYANTIVKIRPARSECVFAA